MQNSLILSPKPLTYSSKEFGPIVVALAFVIAVGGLTAAAIIICGWHHVKSVGMNWTQRRAEIVCR